MKLSDFQIGSTFSCDGARWRVTDVGTRVVVAVRSDFGDTTRRSTRADMQDAGEPPGTKDSVGVECVFAENDQARCEPV